MNDRPKSPETSTPAATPQITWSVGFRGLVSVLILIHVTALFVGPCASPPPSSYWAQGAERLYTPYLHATFLHGHGYRFFAPNPGPSHLIRYELLNEADEKIGEGNFPSLKEHWPRLFYHRHFMISESMYNISNVPNDPPPPEAPEFVRQQFETSIGLRNAYLDSIAKYLARQHPEAAKIRIVRVTHGIPFPQDVAKGMKLNDPSLYEELVLGVYTVQEEDRQ